MRKLMIGCAVAGMIALSPKSEARLPASLGPLPFVSRGLGRCQLGVASWYGSERQGKPTASGEPFDMNGLTGAHRELPLGTTVRVTNLRNLRSVKVKINDRGPGVAGRLIDVSWAAAKSLGFVGWGLAPVAVEIIGRPQASLRRVPDRNTSRLN